MNIGIITTPNIKGQIVIPKQIRDQLGISPQTPLNLVIRNQGFWAYPVESVKIKMDTENSYASILKKTRGSWSLLTKNETAKAKRKRKLELTAFSQRKQAW